MSAKKKTDGVVAYVAVGSNIEPEQHIIYALVRLAQYVPITATSTFYRSEPVGRPEQPPFLNGVWRIETALPSRDVKFDLLRPIETALGRVRSRDRFAPRKIDLDLILYGDEVIDEAGLKLPDPAIATRPYVAVPLLELAPKLVLPDTGRRLAETEAAADTKGMKAMKRFTNQLRKRLKQWTDSA